jgi:hypothetical protein
MDDEKLLPVGEEPESQTPEPSRFHLEHKLAPPPAAEPSKPSEAAPPTVTFPVESAKKNTVPNPVPSPAPVTLPGVPSPARQSWGAVISIVIIVLMVIIGAFYAWGQRISQNQNIVPVVPESPAATTTNH